jgi:hypothetical protein
MDFEDPYPITFLQKIDRAYTPIVEFYQGGETIAAIICPNKIASSFYYSYSGPDRISHQMPKWIKYSLSLFDLEEDTLDKIYYWVLRAANDHVDWLKTNKPILETKKLSWKKHGF